MQVPQEPSRWTKVGRRMAGLLWLSAWAVLIGVFASPWPHMGGIVDERVRWAVRFFPSAAFIVGCAVGDTARDAACRRGRPTHAKLLRWALFPAATVAAVGMGLVEVQGREDIAGVVVLVLLGWAAGLDAGFAFWPLLFGRPYRFAAPIPAEPALDDEDDDRDRDDEI